MTFYESISGGIMVGEDLATHLLGTISDNVEPDETIRLLSSHIRLFARVKGLYEVGTLRHIHTSCLYVDGFAEVQCFDAFGDEVARVGFYDPSEYEHCTILTIGDNVNVPNYSESEMTTYGELESAILSKNRRVFIEPADYECFFDLHEMLKFFQESGVELTTDFFVAFYSGLFDSVTNYESKVFKIESGKLLVNTFIFEMAKDVGYILKQDFVKSSVKSFKNTLHIDKEIIESETMPTEIVSAPFYSDLFKLLRDGIFEHFKRDRKIDPTKEAFTKWLEQEAIEREITLSDNVKKLMFTIAKSPDHNPRRKRT